MLYYYHLKCILTLITLIITLTLILNLALTFSLTLSRIVHSSFTSGGGKSVKILYIRAIYFGTHKKTLFSP